MSAYALLRSNLEATSVAWQIQLEFFSRTKKEGLSVFRGMETQIRKNHDRWCLVHVRYSTLPAEKKGGTE